MKTKLLKKWRKQCECTNIEPLVYCSARGDRFFTKYAKYSRHWPLIKVECELNGLSPDNIYDTNHPLHSRFAPSKRLHFTAHRHCQHKPFFDFDFSSLYPIAINAAAIHKKSFEIGNKVLDHIEHKLADSEIKFMKLSLYDTITSTLNKKLKTTKTKEKHDCTNTSLFGIDYTWSRIHLFCRKCHLSWNKRIFQDLWPKEQEDLE